MRCKLLLASSQLTVNPPLYRTLLSHFDDIRLSAPTASPNSKGITVLGLNSAKIPSDQGFYFNGDFTSSLINVCDESGTN